MNIRTLTQRLISANPNIDGLIPEIEGTAEEMMSGAASPAQMAAFLTALHMRGETPPVVAAFVRTLRKNALPFSAPENVVDTCGTGGDHSGTFNISTTAAFVAAGAGVKVAKHGNRSFTSKCGSADVLAQLGIRVDCEPAIMEQALNTIGICFLHAQCYHLSMKHVGPVRRELGFRTIFNILGPLANPANAAHQLLGVFGLKEARLMADVLALLSTSESMVVHGSDGLDEITTTGETHVFRVKQGQVFEEVIVPEQFGIARATREDYLGGEAGDNANIVLEILKGKPGPKADIVLINAGATIQVAGLAPDLATGVEMARKSIESGSALHKLEELIRLTNQAPEAVNS